MFCCILYNFTLGIAPTAAICSSTGLLGCSPYGIWIPLPCGLLAFCVLHPTMWQQAAWILLCCGSLHLPKSLWGVLNDMDLLLLYFQLSCLAKRMCYLKEQFHLKVNGQMNFYFSPNNRCHLLLMIAIMAHFKWEQTYSPPQYTQGFFPNKFIH